MLVKPAYMCLGSSGHYFYFSDRPPPPQKKKKIQNFEPPKVDRTYLFMIILEYHPPPLRRKLTIVYREVYTKK